MSAANGRLDHRVFASDPLTEYACQLICKFMRGKPRSLLRLCFTCKRFAALVPNMHAVSRMICTRGDNCNTYTILCNLHAYKCRTCNKYVGKHRLNKYLRSMGITRCVLCARKCIICRDKMAVIVSEKTKIGRCRKCACG